MKKETKEKAIQITKIILKIIAASGFISMALLAPNAIQVLDMFRDKKRSRYNPSHHIKSTLSRLKDQGLIEFQKRKGKTFIRLTDKGEKKLLKYQLQEAFIPKPKKWDKKWRIVIFDIREDKRWIRDFLRKELVNLGFIKLQDSVWVHPYDCEEIIILLKAYLRRGKDVLYITAENIENDKWLKREFKLLD